MGVTGYNEVKDTCEELGITVITPTPIRHRSSTMLWNIEFELDDYIINRFMEHITALTRIRSQFLRTQ